MASKPDLRSSSTPKIYQKPVIVDSSQYKYMRKAQNDTLHPKTMENSENIRNLHPSAPQYTTKDMRAYPNHSCDQPVDHYISQLSRLATAPRQSLPLPVLHRQPILKKETSLQLQLAADKIQRQLETANREICNLKQALLMLETNITQKDHTLKHMEHELSRTTNALIYANTRAIEREDELVVVQGHLAEALRVVHRLSYYAIPE